MYLAVISYILILLKFHYEEKTTPNTAEKYHFYGGSLHWAILPDLAKEYFNISNIFNYLIIKLKPHFKDCYMKL